MLDDIWNAYNNLRCYLGLKNLGPRSRRFYRRIFIHLSSLIFVLPLFVVSFSFLSIGEQLITLLSLSLATISLSLAISSYSKPDQWFPEDVKHAIITSEPTDWEYQELIDQNHEQYVYKENRDIILQFSSLNKSREFNEPWTQNYEDETAYRRRLDITYQVKSYEEKYIISVDGRRNFIPMPKSALNTKISEFEYELGRILNGTPAEGLARDVDEYLREYDEALNLAGIKR